MAWKVNRLLITLILLIKITFSFAQLQLDENEWKEQRLDRNYTKVEKEPQPKETKKDTPPVRTNNRRNFNFNEISDIVKLIFFVIIIGVLVFLIYKFILNNTDSINQDDDLVFIKDLKKAEENLMKADLNKLLDQFLAQHDYRSAIRVQYLQVIQSMSKKKVIKWAKDKTNHEYYLEINDSNLSINFKSTTRIYEQAWFGREQINRSSYNRISSLGTTLISQVNA